MHKKSIRLDTFLEPYTHLCASEKSSAQFYTYEWFFASQLKSCTIQTCTIPRNLEQTLAILDNFHISLRSDTTKYNLDTTQLKIMQNARSYTIRHRSTQPLYEVRPVYCIVVNTYTSNHVVLSNFQRNLSLVLPSCTNVCNPAQTSTIAYSPIPSNEILHIGRQVCTFYLALIPSYENLCNSIKSHTGPCNSGGPCKILYNRTESL